MASSHNINWTKTGDWNGYNGCKVLTWFSSPHHARNNYHDRLENEAAIHEVIEKYVFNNYGGD